MFPASSFNGPVAAKERIESLDLLRGVALLGILLVNIQSISSPVYSNPTAYGDLNGTNYTAWLLTFVLANQKFITIFCMLFGAGVHLFTTRIEAAGVSARALHYRRMSWLIAFGLLHGYLLWFGDILVHYGICGMLLYPLRNLRRAQLVAVGGILIAIPIAAGWIYGVNMSPADLREFQDDVWPTTSRIAHDLAAYRGGWSDEFQARAAATLDFETTLFAWEYVWREMGLMLIGIALLQSQVFSARLPARAYWTMLLGGLLVGIPVVLYGVHGSFASGWSVRYVYFIGPIYNYFGSLFVAMAWVAATMLLFQSGRLLALTTRLAAVGRTAFSNYILQTIIATTLFYGHGFGLYGHVSRSGAILFVFAIWAVQLWLSHFWLTYFRFGPLEWLWRSLTYWKAQPFRRLHPTVAP